MIRFRNLMVLFSGVDVTEYFRLPRPTSLYAQHFLDIQRLWGRK